MFKRFSLRAIADTLQSALQRVFKRTKPLSATDVIADEDAGAFTFDGTDGQGFDVGGMQ